MCVCFDSVTMCFCHGCLVDYANWLINYSEREHVLIAIFVLFEKSHMKMSEIWPKHLSATERKSTFTPLGQNEKSLNQSRQPNDKTFWNNVHQHAVNQK